MPRTPSPVPGVNTNFLNPLTDAFFQHENARLKGLLADLILRNHILGGHELGFYANGHRLTLASGRQLRGQSLQPVHRSLLAEATELRVDLDQLNIDTLRLPQHMAVVVGACTTSEDVRDALPEPLIMLIPQFQGVPRTREAGWILKERPVLKSQFDRMNEIILRYQAYRLIF